MLTSTPADVCWSKIKWKNCSALIPPISVMQHHPLHSRVGVGKHSQGMITIIFKGCIHYKGTATGTWCVFSGSRWCRWWEETITFICTIKAIVTWLLYVFIVCIYIVCTAAAIPCFWCCSGSKQSTDIWGSSIAGWWRDPQKTSPWRRRGMPTTCAVHYCRRAPRTRMGWQRLPSWILRLKSPDWYYYWYCLSS